MPCYSPIQAFYEVSDEGKKVLVFSNALARLFSLGGNVERENALSLPCGNCMGCRLEKSRQWALRCVHEAKCYESNCFITLTYSNDNLPFNGSLVRKDPQDFIKRLRERFAAIKIRYYGCGEYGDQLSRPHYHLCLFNFDFPDRVLFSSSGGMKYFTSDILTKLWGKGHCLVTDFSFETAAYVARYCVKKINGVMAKDYYNNRLPEFSMMSLKPGIGAVWLDKFGKSDVFPHDSCIARGHECKPPRYYDKLRERADPGGFLKVKEARKLEAAFRVDDNTAARLDTKLRCMRARMSKLIRKFEDR